MNLRTVILPTTLTKIGPKLPITARLEYIEIPQNVVEIDSHVFYNNQLLTALTIPNGVTRIADDFAVDCDDLQKLEFSDHTTKKVRNGVEIDLTKILEKHQQILWVSSIKNGTLKIDSFIQFDRSLTKLDIPSSVSYIRNNAFETLLYLKEIKLPNDLKFIGKNIFGLITSLTTIDFGNNDISKFAVPFDFALRMSQKGIFFTNITFGDYDYKNYNYGFNIYEMSKITKYVIGDLHNNKLFDEIPNFSGLFGDMYFSTSKLNLPSTLTEIAESAFTSLEINSIDIKPLKEIPKMCFAYCKSLTKVVFSSELSNIQNEAFKECVSLKTIILPKSLNEIGENAFEKCFCLEHVYCDNENVVYNKKCFSECYSLVAIPKLKNVKNGAFMECTSLKSATLVDGCTKIADLQFFKCFSLSTIEVPTSVTRIGVFAFRKCISLSDLSFGKNITIVDDGAFMDCTQLNNVVFGNKNILGKVDLFEGCISLRSLHFGANVDTYAFEVSYSMYDLMKVCGVLCENVCVKRADVTKYGLSYVLSEMQTNKNIHRIDEGCFFTNDEIVEVEIPSQITSIGIFAFYACVKLKKVVLSESITEIPEFCFSNCTNLKEIDIKGKIEKFGFNCFELCDKIKSNIEIPI
ncbi:hypothetical protein EIN_331220 [Entamoeba invadens IP1]|uniref:Leucine rich repeat containing protein BspA family protein n=1 Tax=Entamoeba invadens IP1 TaxID=370355 RepID=A0A0A1TZU8_ENTIV|nr:hypothetical protein EIN_331220 [Entamoeba invadens IP1]ELP85721.1 hypothetical protein EIN_331220 [Entamoeba invadens IP1]|eukprot:XP_004185067.1 hypothetical protein EIN_331220 [Entamoeba invadens IP1]